MKAVKFSKILGQSMALHAVRGALAAPALLLTFTFAQAGSPAAPTVPAEEAPLSNWIGFTVGGAFVSGNDAGMMRRTQTNGDFYGGIDSFQFSKALNDKTTLTLDGHALPGMEDYEGNINLTQEGVGYLKTGYKQYRTWYDGSGGYMPQLSGQYTEPGYGDDLHLDRGEFYLEAGLRMEKVPEITFKYNHAFRNGQKDSTSWSERPRTTGTSTTPYKFLPSLWDIDETVDTFSLEVEHTLGNTDFGIGLTYEHVDYSNTLSFDRGSIKTVAGTPPTVTSSLLNVTRTDAYTMDLFSGNVHSVTRFNDKFWLTGGFAYTTVDTDSDGSSGSIVRAASTPASTGTASSFNTQNGGSGYEECVGNLNLMWNPIPDLTITPSVRVEHSSQNAVTAINKYDGTGATVAGQAFTADIDTNSTTGQLDLRYVGISDLVLYARGQWGYEEQTKLYRDIYVPWDPSQPVASAPVDWLRDEIELNEQEYSLGANWYPMSGLSFSVQGLHSQRDQSYAPTGHNHTGGFNLRPNMMDHDTTVDDINVRMTWRPMSNVSLVTRYDFRLAEYDNRGVMWTPGTTPGGPPPMTPGSPMTGILPEVESGNITAHILSQSVTWSPMARLYVQGNISYTWAETETDSRYTPDSDNDYVSGNLTVGYAVDDKTDITLSYNYYGADNYAQQGAPYVADGSNDIPNDMGFGLNTEEHSLSLSINRMLAPNMIWNLRYAFITSNTDSMPDQTGGYNDFDAQMISTGLQIRF